MNKVIKSSFWYTISSFLVSGISIITTPIFTRLLTLNEYGSFSNFNAIYGIISTIVTLNLHSTLSRARFDYKDNENIYISNMLYISSASSFVAIIVLNIFYEYIASILGMNRILLNILLLTALFLPAINIFQTWQRIQYEYKKSVLVSLLLSVGNIVLSLIFVFSFSDKLLGRIIGCTLPTILIGAVIMFSYFKKERTIKVEYWKYALAICIPYVPHLLSGNLLSQLDRIMITNMCGAEKNALYSLAVNCSMIMTIIISSLNSSYAPWLGEQLHAKNYERIKKVTYMYVLLFVAVLLGNLLFAPEILLIFGGKKYMEAVYLIPPVVLGCMCQLLYTLYVNIEQFEKETVGMAIATTVAALFNWVSNAFAIEKFGYQAAAYTTFFSYLLLLIIHYCLVRKMKKHIVYDNKFIFGILFALVVVVALFIQLYDMIIIRYILCLVYIIAIIVAAVIVLKSGLLKKGKE